MSIVTFHRLTFFVLCTGATMSVFIFAARSARYRWRGFFGKDTFYPPPPFFYREYVFLMYFLITRHFSSMAFLWEMHNKRDINF